jgi:hypothetical protein
MNYISTLYTCTCTYVQYVHASIDRNIGLILYMYATLRQDPFSNIKSQYPNNCV